MTTSPCFLVPEPVLEGARAAHRPGTPEAPRALERLAVLHRIDTLAALRAANHGWLGASFSAMDLMTTLYHTCLPDPRLPVTERSALILSKGHAVAAQYAILGALGAFPRERLLTYKALDGLPAHCDREVPGIDADSGSLGQGLSKGIGLALAHRAAGRPHRVFVILGDGELQEGQVFESLLTLRRLGLRACLPIIDRNFLQSDSQTAEIKDAEDWASVLRGLGYLPVTIDGHDPAALLALLRGENRGPRPLAVIAQTRKGFGTRLTTMAADTPRREGVWHGRIPADDEYSGMLAELVERFDDPDLTTAFTAFRQGASWQGTIPGPTASTGPAPTSGPPHPTPPSSGAALHSLPPGAGPASATAPDTVSERTLSTGEGFGQALVGLAPRFPSFHVLDADLEKACRLTPFARAFPERFIEMGISEQDMVSVGAGLGLGGRVAVVNTYASFFKRALDQMFTAATEGLPVIFAGHYAGLDYFTDGKSHQSVQDIGLVRALGGIDVFEPLTPPEAGQVLDHLLARMTREVDAGSRSRPAYVRLHRTPVAGLPAPAGPFVPGSPTLFPAAGRAEVTVFAASPWFVRAALAVQQQLAGEGLPIEVVGVSQYAEGPGRLADLAAAAARPVSLESHRPTGGLADLLAPWCRAPLHRLGPTRWTGSARRLEDLLAVHGLTEEGLAATLREIARGRAAAG
ncbi:MAG: hypothetical protein GX442_19970 [Candidatus Riflebacteria bacterium]|nr:hypothetical protein [Candidatus Riflebacteria bacterium]